MSQNRRKICVVTGSRAEYGLLSQLIGFIKEDPALILQTIVTGMHLSPEFALTYREIEQDGITIDAKVEMLLSSDSNQGITKSVGLGLIGFADALTHLEPDLIVILGDRFEMLAAAQAALLFRIPIAHIHGGETSLGAYDEAIRHAITKMSTWHFVAAEPYRKRVIQMGELPERVFNVGAPGLDNLKQQNFMSRETLEGSLEMTLKAPIFLITYHPVTATRDSFCNELDVLFEALDSFPDTTLVFTHPNADSDGRIMISKIEAFVQKHSNRAKSFASLGRLRYLSLMRYADVVIGNSSSGIIEAPYFHKATVNIGSRQDGRLKASSIIDVPLQQQLICQAIEKSLSDAFTKTLHETQSLYGEGNASLQITEQLKKPIPSLSKLFFDLRHEY